MTLRPMANAGASGGAQHHGGEHGPQLHGRHGVPVRGAALDARQPGAVRGADKARSHCRCVPPLIYFIPDPLR
jgi:hypothetical protein